MVLIGALGGVLLLVLLGFRIRGVMRHRNRKRRAELLQAAQRELNPARRRSLMLAWNDLGGMADFQAQRQRKLARLQGEQARGEGRPRSANPFSSRWWGAGKAWNSGWWRVEQNIRWIESHRRG
ncbi:MAG: hypothetical protein OEW39_10670 [Deltaproteobacteria bacterium]|nr:hypothetical protein [Deltaproteobacteria bacterium]